MRRNEIVASILEALKPLNISLYEWRVAPAEFSELPIIVVKDKDDNIDEEASGSDRHSLKIEIEYTNAKKDLTANDIREILALILEKLKEEDEKDIRACDYASVKNIEIDFEHHEVIVGRGIIELEIIYHTEKWGI